MRCLVTGGAGFIGRALCTRLLDEGCSVTAVDDLSSARRADLAPLLARPNFAFVQADVRTPFDVPCDRLFHAACPASPADYGRDPVFTLTTAVTGTLNALTCALRYGARVVVLSTSEVYGEPDQHPQPETYPGRVDPVGPRACYVEGKRAAETLGADFARTRGLDVRIARIFNTYGPGMRPDDGRVIPAFVAAALAGRPLRVFGDGAATRSFCYIDDMVTQLVRLAAVPDVPGPVNVGNDEETRIDAVARLIVERVGGAAGVVSDSPRPGDPTRRRPDLTRARALRLLDPPIPFAVGLARTIAWCQSLPVYRR